MDERYRAASERMKRVNHVHGLRAHPLYSVWKNMCVRCEDACCKSFKNYGGRGIKVSPRWKHVGNFIADMYPTFAPGLTLERLDVNGDYERFNCVWIPRKVQARNRTDSLYVDTPYGRMLICEAAELYEIKYTTLRWRLVTKQMPATQALTYKRHG